MDNNTTQSLNLIIMATTDDTKTELHLKISKTIALILTFFGSIGNCLIIYFFAHQRHQNNKKSSLKTISTYNIWTILLAVTDLIVCLLQVVRFGFPIFGIPNIPNMDETLGHGVCVAVSVSCWSICALSYDRYRAIVHPLKPRLKLKLIGGIYSIFWLLAFLFKSTAQSMNMDSLISLMFYHVVFETSLPIISLRYYFIRISKTFKQRDVLDNVAIKERNKRALRVCKRLILCYVICVVPARAFILIGQILRDKLNYVFDPTKTEGQIYNYVIYYFDAFIVLNSCVNVLVYVKQIPAFRTFLIKTFARRQRSQK